MAQPQDWRDPSRRQRIVVKLDEAIRSYPGNVPSHMSNGFRLEETIFQKAKSKEEYNIYVGRLLLSLTRHRSSLPPQAAMQPSFPPQPVGHVMQPQPFLPATRQPHPSQQSYYLSPQPGGMSSGQPHPSPAPAHMQPGGPSSYGMGYPAQLQQPRPQMMGGAGMLPHAPRQVTTLPRTKKSTRPHPPGGPHPPGPSPGMHGLGPAMAPSPSIQPPPSVQSQEDSQEYDRKVKELMQYIPVMKRMIDSLMRKARESGDPALTATIAEKIGKLKLMIGALQDPERRLSMDMLDKWRKALSKVPLPKQQRDSARPPSDGGSASVPTSSQPAPFPGPESASTPPPHLNVFGEERPRQDIQEERNPAKLRTEEGFTESDCSTLYLKAIKDNPTITLNIAKAMTIGPPRVGKTSLRHRLLGLPLPEISSSTPVMKAAETVSVCPSDCTSADETEVVPCDEPSSDSESETSSDDSDDDLDVRVAKRIKLENHMVVAAEKKWVMVNSASGMRSLLDFLQRKMNVASIQNSTDPDGRQSEAPVQPSSDIPPPDENNLNSISNVIQQMYQELQKSDIENVALPDAHLLQFLDSGGQLAYHDILPLFVNIPAIYLHVFNVTKELTERPIDELCSPGGEKKYSAKSALSVAEMITRSVMTVHSLADKKVQLPSEVKCESESPEPRIVLVGTHLDELDEKDQDAKLKAVNETLCNALQSESDDLEGMVMKNSKPTHMFFPVTNNPDADKSHQSCKNCKSRRLMKRIRDQVMEDAVKVQVPVRWYLRQLLELSQGEQKPLYQYSKLYQRCKGEGSIADIGEFHAMVTYFHALGLLIHLCGADVGHTEDSDCLVFTNPSYLFENISKLYQVQFEEEVEGKGKIALKRKGKLTKEALRSLKVEEAQLSHDQFMDLLVQLFIGAEIKSHEGVRTLFVPSVLTSSAADATPSGVDAAAQKNSLCFAITFKHTSFIPCGVFTGMIARLQSATGWDICTSSISRTLMKFAVALGTVNVADLATHISVEIDGNEELKHGQCQVYRDTIIRATADSYCFLFHSKADKDPRSGTCRVCMDRPYLVLGQTCHRCPPQPGGTRQVPHFDKLKVESCVPKSVHCPKLEVVRSLDSAIEQGPFQNVSHYAVVKEQRTGKEAVTGNDLPHVSPERAEQVLDHFRDQFIADMDANSVVMGLLHEDIIHEGDQREISKVHNPHEQNEILHLYLKKKCTNIALKTVCDLVIRVAGNPKMTALGKAMKNRLEAVVQEQVDHTPQTHPTVHLQDSQDVPGPSWRTPPPPGGRRHSRQWTEEESRPAKWNKGMEDKIEKCLYKEETQRKAKSRTALQANARTVVAAPVTCEQCQRTFRRSGDFKRHKCSTRGRRRQNGSE